MNDLLSISQLSKQDIQNILKLSLYLNENSVQTLQGKNIIFAFEKPSLRTKVGTEVAINHLGGSVIHIEPQNFFEGKILFSKKGGETIQGRESLKDTIKNVDSWCDAIFARVFEHQTLKNISKISSIPLVNALCDEHHPMQALADLLTIQEHFGQEKISLTYIGDANNVAFSLIEIMLIFGHKVAFSGPKECFFSEEKTLYLKKLARKNSTEIIITDNPQEAVKNTDIIYTDTFVSMGEEHIFEEKMKLFNGYQVNKNLLSYTGKKTCFMHCLPAHRNIEVTDEVIDSDISLVYQQAKNRMVVSKGVFTKLLNPNFSIPM